MKIELKDLEFGYGNSTVLSGINLSLDEPKFVCILGPNGVGKSTLIHCMNKILKPNPSSVFYDDTVIEKIPLKRLAQRMGYVPNNSDDLFPMTVFDTVLMGCQVNGGLEEEDEDVIRTVYESLDLLGIEDLAMREFNQLSAGQHQKVVIARALARRPEVLLLDEPTSNLDIRHQLEVTKLLMELTRRNRMTVIMISHNLNIALKYADEVLFIHNGGIRAYGKPDEVVTPEILKEVFDVDSEVVSYEGRPVIMLKDVPSKFD